MTHSDKGIHHITVMGGDGQRTTDFYVQTLGLRMIMKTVNQDDPTTYHLFYVNGTGQPGSSMTFFPWPMAVQGKPGSGKATIVSFSVPSESLGFWAERFGEMGVDFDGPFERFGSQVLRFTDPDLLTLELVFDKRVNDIPAWEEGTVPAEYGIRGFWGTQMDVTETEATGQILESAFGFKQTSENGSTLLYETGSPVAGSVILNQVDPKHGTNGRGIVHHVAFRAKDRDEQMEMRKKVQEFGMRPTQVIDRHFFKSVYFESPGGVLFEIATDGPGYKAMQSEEDLGHRLWLPDKFEKHREMIEKRLPDIKI